MPTQPYRLADGTKIPSVTTVLARFKDPGGLMHWAWRLGMEGRDYRDVRDDAAEAGTLAHAMIEADIRNLDMPSFRDHSDDVVTEACAAFTSYQEWRAVTGIAPERAEVSLVSERHKYGGTYDALAAQGRRLLCDWKTSKGIYSEAVIQLGGYAVLHDEHFPSEPLDGGIVVRFGRDGSGWEQLDVTPGQLRLARDAFLRLRRAYALVHPIDLFLNRRRARIARGGGGPPDDIATDSFNAHLAAIEDDAA
jgi:hypothetical protein